MTVIVGLDLSLTSTGIARLVVGPDVEHTAGVRRVTSKPPPPAQVTLSTRSLRLRRIAGDVYNVTSGADLVVVEGPSYASDSGAAHDRAGLWWLIVGRLTGTGHPVIEVPPSTLKTYLTGKGNAPKDQVLAAVVRRYPAVDVTGNDEADSLGLAAMGARFVGYPIEPDGLPKTHTRAMDAVRWTPTTR